MKSYHLICTNEPQNDTGTVYGSGSYEVRADDDVSAIEAAHAVHGEALAASARATLLDAANGRPVFAWKHGVAQEF
jgi:hypothetical protein